MFHVRFPNKRECSSPSFTIYKYQPDFNHSATISSPMDRFYRYPCLSYLFNALPDVYDFPSLGAMVADHSTQTEKYIISSHSLQGLP